MSDDCKHGHNSQSEETYFYKETARVVADLRRMATALQQAADKSIDPKITTVAAPVRTAA